MVVRSAKRSGVWSFTVLVVVMLMQSTSAWAATPIDTCGSQIRYPGEYVLTEDLICDGPGIIIAANRVVLNLNGHSITGTNNQHSGLVVGAGVGTISEVNIVGPGTISNFFNGVELFGAENSSVRGVTSTLNVNAFNFANYPGLPPSRLNTIENNLATANRGYGFLIDEADQNTFRGNKSTGNIYGFFLFDAHENRLELNETEENSTAGISAAPGATNNLIRGNTALNNNRWDLFDGDFSGCANTWEDNMFGKANKPCIH